MPVATLTVTAVASGPSCSASRRAAMTLTPLEVPPNRPGYCAKRPVILLDSRNLVVESPVY
jgi:hypothetical protein